MAVEWTLKNNFQNSLSEHDTTLKRNVYKWNQNLEKWETISECTCISLVEEEEKTNLQKNSDILVYFCSRMWEIILKLFYMYYRTK